MGSRMAVFCVNGKEYQSDESKKLLRFLRDDLRLTSVKDGCSEGACGTCSVLIDGKLTKACVPSLNKLEGKSVLTVEGLSPAEKEIYSRAFAEAGAVQCGFCTPGMILAAKSLLDVRADPSREEAAYAIRNNICRCTGYKKIIDGILLAGKYKREGLPPEEAPQARVGARMPRIDAVKKALGEGKYVDDIYLPGMIYGGAVRSKYPRARVLAIHTEAAAKLPGVLGIYTAEDILESTNALHPRQKLRHYFSEKHLVERFEPLATASWLMGAKYPQWALERAWKYVLENHAHDSLGCCSVDEV